MARGYSKMTDRRPGLLFLRSVRTTSQLQGDVATSLRTQIQNMSILLNQARAVTRQIMDYSLPGRIK